MCAVYSDMRLIGPDGAPLGRSWLGDRGLLPPPSGPELFRRLLLESFLPAPAVMVKRAALDTVGTWDETLVFEDYDMWLRLLDRYEMRFVPGELVEYRVHPTSLSRRADRVPEFMVDIGRVQARWRGRYPEVDRTNVCRLWAQGRRQLLDDVGSRLLLDLAGELVPSTDEALALEARDGGRAARRAGEATRAAGGGDRAAGDCARGPANGPPAERRADRSAAGPARRGVGRTRRSSG